jgi:energy coupling factor transporter S component ThiW
MKTKDVARAAIFTALAVALSPLSIPVGTTKVFPIQAFVNVIAAVLIGPWYAILVAFVTSLLRNFLGTGTINAFAGSMIGAALAGFIWRATRNIYLSAAGEIFGTGVLATLVTVYIVAPHISHKHLALATIGAGFLASTVLGSVIALIVLKALSAAGYGPASRRERLATARQ